MDISNTFIDPDKTISFYNKTKEIGVLSLHVWSWLIRVSKENMGAFIQQLPEIHNMLYPNGCEGNEFISRVKVLRELDAFTIDLRDKDVVYISYKSFDHI